ncbi:MAG: hypothetical protein LV480_00735 [Methylacidiphilales bacterium]|nr:hypothetical protein [Candidatus Methylacidiphilales bacterium]
MFLIIGVSTLFTSVNAAPILINSDFAEGRAHWKGDAKDLDNSGQVDLTTGNSTTPGVIITLKKDKWTRIYQAFSVRNGKLYYSITFKLSPDYKIAVPTGNNNNASSAPDVSDIPYMWTESMSEYGWAMLVVENVWGMQARASEFFQPDPRKPSPQTLTGRLNELNVGPDATFVLFFPPGQGSITLLNISLSPYDPNANS